MCDKETTDQTDDVAAPETQDAPETAETRWVKCAKCSGEVPREHTVTGITGNVLCNACAASATDVLRCAKCRIKREC